MPPSLRWHPANTVARWVYYINLMMMAPAIALQVFYYRPPNFKQLHGNTRTKWQEAKRIDVVGCFLLVAGLCLFILGVSWGKSLKHWIGCGERLTDTYLRRTTTPMDFVPYPGSIDLWRAHHHHLCLLG